MCFARGCYAAVEWYVILSHGACVHHSVLCCLVILSHRVRPLTGNTKGSAADEGNLDMLLHDLDVAASACGITRLGTITHLSGGRFVLRSSSASGGESGLVYDVRFALLFQVDFSANLEVNNGCVVVIIAWGG